MSVTYETSFTMRGTTELTLQPHQVLCLPRHMTHTSDARHIWNIIYNARSNRTHHPTSPNTAPATLNDSHDWCPSHMKRHLQGVRFCLKTNEVSFTMRDRFEHDPTMIRTPARSPSFAFCIENYNISRSSYPAIYPNPDLPIDLCRRIKPLQGSIGKKNDLYFFQEKDLYFLEKKTSILSSYIVINLEFFKFKHHL